MLAYPFNTQFPNFYFSVIVSIFLEEFTKRFAKSFKIFFLIVFHSFAFSTTRKTTEVAHRAEKMEITSCLLEQLQETSVTTTDFHPVHWRVWMQCWTLKHAVWKAVFKVKALFLFKFLSYFNEEQKEKFYCQRGIKIKV